MAVNYRAARFEGIASFVMAPAALAQAPTPPTPAPAPVYTSSISYSPAYDPLDSTGSHFVLGGRLGMRTKDGRYGIAAYARNLTDQRVPTLVIDTPTAIPIPGAPGVNEPNSHAQYFGPDPFRTVGVYLDARF